MQSQPSLDFELNLNTLSHYVKVHRVLRLEMFNVKSLAVFRLSNADNAFISHTSTDTCRWTHTVYLSAHMHRQRWCVRHAWLGKDVCTLPRDLLSFSFVSSLQSLSLSQHDPLFYVSLASSLISLSLRLSPSGSNLNSNATFSLWKSLNMLLISVT